MKKDVFNNIKEQLKNYKYSSMEYTEYEDISDYEVICSNEQVILIFGYNLEAELYEFHWATSNVSILISELNKSKEKKVLITFIPTEWIEEFKKNKFDMYAIFNDYFNNNISKSLEPLEAIEFLKECDCKEASEVTRSCRDQSRGFSGQSKWLEQWIKGVEPNAVSSCGKDSAVLVHRENDMIRNLKD